MLWNRWDEVVATGDVRDAVRRRFHTIVDAAGLDEDRARDWVVLPRGAQRPCCGSRGPDEPRPGRRPASRSPRRSRTDRTDCPGQRRSGEAGSRHESPRVVVRQRRPRRPLEAQAGSLVSAIDKLAARGTGHRATTLGLEGDEVADTGPRRHLPGGLRLRPGGPRLVERERSARPSARDCSARTSRPRGIDVNEARARGAVADRHGALRRSPRCASRAGLPELAGPQGLRRRRSWVKRFTERRAAGASTSRSSSRARRRPATRSTSMHRPDHGVTVGTMFRALTTEPRAAARCCWGRRAAARGVRQAQAYVDRLSPSPLSCAGVGTAQV